MSNFPLKVFYNIDNKNDSKSKTIEYITYLESKPCWSCRKAAALLLKLEYALSSPISKLFSSTIKTIMDKTKYAKPVTITVDLSPTDSSLWKYWTVNANNNFLNSVKERYFKMVY